MYLDVCPMLDDLRRFLDQELELSRQAEIGMHVDRCPSCQATLEGLTQVEASELLRSSLDVLTGPDGPSAEAQVPSDRLTVVTDGTEGLPLPDTEAQFASRLDGESTVASNGI